MPACRFLAAFLITALKGLDCAGHLLQNGLQPLRMAHFSQDLLQEGPLGLCEWPVASQGIIERPACRTQLWSGLQKGHHLEERLLGAVHQLKVWVFTLLLALLLL